MKPKPIDTAPKDGTVILTDCGFVRFLNQKQWASPITEGWAECAPDGYLHLDYEGEEYSCEPKQWVPKPDWIAP